MEDRLGLYDYLHKSNIYAQVHYVPLHLTPYYKQLGNKEGDQPVMEEYYKQKFKKTRPLIIILGENTTMKCTYLEIIEF